MKSILILLTLILLINCFQIETVFVRKNSKHFRAKDWREFREGLKVMKSRDIRNPLGFYFQANIHGWSEYNGTEIANFIADKYNWHKCTHKQYFFPVWHRMYLYFFERILRDATGNPHFTLPYWNYHDDNERQIPEPFRIPADEETNPFYVKGRCDSLNNGKPLNAKITNPLPALRSPFFAANKSNNDFNVCNSFGGGRIDRPIFRSDREGLMETLPHDQLHF